jgi:stearoyl-CoA desaturase (Delta-9 desaturase)
MNIVVRYQHKYFFPLALFFGLVVPSLIANTWGDAIGGFLYGGIIARVITWHATFCINR